MLLIPLGLNYVTVSWLPIGHATFINYEPVASQLNV